MTLSNELAPSAFYTYQEVKVTRSYSQDIKGWFFRNSENVRLEVTPSAGTPATADASALTVLSIPKDTDISGIRLRSILLVQLRRTQEGILGAMIPITLPLREGALFTGDSALTR